MTKRCRNLFFFLAVVLFASCIGACGIQRLETPESVVARRAQARWNALIQGDLETAYGYLSPGYRAAKSLDRYRRGIFGVGKWRQAQVEKVVCDRPEVCKVTVQVTIRLPVPRGEPIESTSPVYERWVYKGGWWYVPAR